MNYYMQESSLRDIADGKEELRSRQQEKVKLSAAEKSRMEKIWKAHTYATSLFMLSGSLQGMVADGNLRKRKALAFLNEKKNSRKPWRCDPPEKVFNEISRIDSLAESMVILLIQRFRGMKYQIHTHA